MNIIILGAGELGRQLAWTLCDKNNRVVVVDCAADRLERLRERLDVMTVHGEGASVSVLKQAGVDKAELLLAVTGNGATNVLACQIARHFGVDKTVCRVAADHFFSAEDDFPASCLGIDHLIFPEQECIDRIMGVIDHQSMVERLTLPHGGAEVFAFRIRSLSPLNGLRLMDFPDRELLARLRFALILRNQRLIVPSGQVTFMHNDEVYAAGPTAALEQLIELAAPEQRPCSLVIVAGATGIGRKLIDALLETGKTVRLVEGDLNQARRAMDEIDNRVMVIQGDPTESDVLEDAGIGQCHAFVSTLRDDEDNILSCVLAKQLGARKTISITNKAEYVDIVPAMNAIDCGFSPRLVAVNSVLSLLSNKTARVHAILQRTHAYVYEFEVQAGAPVCNKRIVDSTAAAKGAILALVVRGETSLPATGDVVLEPGDLVVIIARPQDVPRLEPLFRKKSFLNL